METLKLWNLRGFLKIIHVWWRMHQTEFPVCSNLFNEKVSNDHLYNRTVVRIVVFLRKLSRMLPQNKKWKRDWKMCLSTLHETVELNVSCKLNSFHFIDLPQGKVQLPFPFSITDKFSLMRQTIKHIQDIMKFCKNLVKRAINYYYTKI